MAATAQRPKASAKVTKAKATPRALPVAATAPAQPSGPYVPASKVFPEFTARALILGVVLSIVLGAANMYVGLRAGLTVSATIPAAVMSMVILRRFKNSNILENTVAMTTGSAGEALGAGLIFTIPAFILAGVWTEINVWETILLGLAGGTLGVLFTVPLRRALVVEAKLPYPEGIATAQVLIAGEEKGSSARILSGGLLIGSSVALAQLGLNLWAGAAQLAARIGPTVGYVATSLSPILMAVGYIVGLRISSFVFLGGVLSFVVFAPALLAMGWPLPANVVPVDIAANPQGALLQQWANNARLIGAGAMITGGFFTLYKIRGSLKSAAQEARASFAQRGQADTRTRTERDIPLGQVMLGIGLLAPLIAIVAYIFTGSLLFALFGLVAAIIAGFFFSSVAGYLAGVVGSSNNPISGVTIVTLLFTSLGLLALGATGAAGIAAALGVAAMICTGAAIAGDNLQDLKSGYLIGSTPRYQQLGLIVGVVGIAIAGPFVLNAIQGTFTLGGDLFPAPQAFVMATLVTSIFGGTANIPMLGLGALVGIVLIALRLPVLPVAVGMYLPFTLSTPIFLGGLVKAFVDRRAEQRIAEANLPAASAKRHRNAAGGIGVLFASGIIAGEALTGLGVIFIIAGTNDVAFAPQAASPLLFGLLGAGTVLLLGGRMSNAAKWGGAALTFLLGAGATWYILSLGPSNYAGFPGGEFWPGLLVFAYVGVLMAYLPLRALLTGKEAEEMPGMAVEH